MMESSAVGKQVMKFGRLRHGGSNPGGSQLLWWLNGWGPISSNTTAGVGACSNSRNFSNCVYRQNRSCSNSPILLNKRQYLLTPPSILSAARCYTTSNNIKNNSTYDIDIDGGGFSNSILGRSATLSQTRWCFQPSITTHRFSSIAATISANNIHTQHYKQQQCCFSSAAGDDESDRQYHREYYCEDFVIESTTTNPNTINKNNKNNLRCYISNNNSFTTSNIAFNINNVNLLDNNRNVYEHQQYRCYHHYPQQLLLTSTLPNDFFANTTNFRGPSFSSAKMPSYNSSRQCSSSSSSSGGSSGTAASGSSGSNIATATAAAAAPQHQQSSSLSTSNVKQEADSEGITLEFKQGLPHLTIPLPSRRELCIFTLRPVTHNVAHLVSMLQTEDRGIDRVVLRTTDGIRIAATASVESLLLADFDLLINDICYRVHVPVQHRATMEEVSDINDVRQLVNKLYAALNVDEHQIARERDVLKEIEDIKAQLVPFEKARIKIVAAAERRTTVLMYCGLGYMALQFGFLARLTWWEYSWDIMEPVTYFVTYGTAIACYAYYVVTKHDFLLPEVWDRQFLLGFHRKARKSGMDVDRYNRLKNRLFDLEADLQRLRDPISLNLPPQHLVKIIAEQAEQGISTKAGPLAVLQQQLKSFIGMKK